ncbi:uncharacterized protein V1518DRAFT_372186 [Limtongia smithiae]|uniref:uncharacterized protein n=1 Tax=Limtongia smithiae TaxID=1125753 RepID=UPI0034CF4CF8
MDGSAVAALSQRACTQCQRHKIRCVSNASGPCVRCTKKGFLCHIAPRKKRMSKKSRDYGAPGGMLSGGAGTMRISMDGRHRVAAHADGASVVAADDASADISDDEEASYDDGQHGFDDGNSNAADEPITRATEGSHAAVARPPAWLAAELTGPDHNCTAAQSPTPLAESMIQSTISTCDEYSVFLSPSCVCPELFRRIVDMDWHHNPVVFSHANFSRPLFRSLVDSPTSPVFALSFQNEPAGPNCSSMPNPPEALTVLAQWRAEYAHTLLPLYFDSINSVQPVVHRQHFMASFQANRESAMLLLAMFAAAIPFASTGTYSERMVIQNQFLQHLLAHYSQKLLIPTIESVQVLTLIADSAPDRGVLIPHGGIVAAAIELRLHVDCSKWDIPSWERALRKSLWSSAVLRDAWTTMRFVGMPKVLSEYYDARPPTASELAQLVVPEGRSATDGGAQAIGSGTALMESSMRSFVAVSRLSEVLLEVNRALYHVGGGSAQSFAAASHIAESLEVRLEDVMSIRDEPLSINGGGATHGGVHGVSGDSALLEPDYYKALMYNFARSCIYSKFLPLRQSSMRMDKYVLDFSSRFLESVTNLVETLNKIRKVKTVSYWPPWITHMTIMEALVLCDVLLALLSGYFKMHHASASGMNGSKNGEADKVSLSMTAEQRRALLTGVLNKERFSARVLFLVNELMYTMAEFAARWEPMRDIYKMLLKTTRSLGLVDVLDAPGVRLLAQQQAQQLQQIQQQQQKLDAASEKSRADKQQGQPGESSPMQPQTMPVAPANFGAYQQPQQPQQPQLPLSGGVPGGASQLPPVYQRSIAGPFMGTSAMASLMQPGAPAGSIEQYGSHLHAQQTTQSPHPQQLYQQALLSQIANLQRQQQHVQEQEQEQLSTCTSMYGPRTPTAAAAPTMSTSAEQQQLDGDSDHTDGGTFAAGQASGNAAPGGTSGRGLFDDIFNNLSAQLFEGSMTDLHQEFIL